MNKGDVNKPLTESQKRFCREYIYDYNASRAYRKAYPNVSDSVAGQCAYKLLKLAQVQAEIQYLKDNLEMVAGLSKLKMVNFHQDIAFSADKKIRTGEKIESAKQISKMMGYEAPTKIENINQAPTNIFLSINEVLKNKVKNAGKG